MTKHKIQLVLMPLFKKDEIALMTVTTAKINKALTTPIVLTLIMSILQLGRATTMSHQRILTSCLRTVTRVHPVVCHVIFAEPG